MRVLALLMTMGWALVAAAPARAQDEREKALQLMRLSGAHELAVQSINTVLPQVKQIIRTANPDLDERFLERLVEEIRSEVETSEDELLSIWAEIYIRHFSGAELDGLIAFWRAPLGQKVIEVMPVVMREGAAAGSAWGRALAVRALERVRARSE